MEVLLVSAEYPPMEGGIGDYTWRLGLALREQGVEVGVLTTVGVKGRPTDPFPVFDRVADWGWRGLVAIRRFLQERRPALLHLQYQTGAYRMHPAVHFLPDLLARMHPSPRFLLTMHDLRLPYLFPKAGRLRHLLVARMLRRADAVVVTNGADLLRLGKRPAARPLAGRDLPPDRDLLRPLPPGTLPALHLIPLGSSLSPGPADPTDRSRRRARLSLPEGAFLLGHFGLLHPSKGADLLVEALAGLREEVGRPVHLLIVGGGTGSTDPGNLRFREDLQRRTVALGLERLVHRTGLCPAAEAAAWLQACDLVVLPYREGASFRRSSLVAALALGCPVVTTEPLNPTETFLGASRPTLERGQNVWLVPRGEVGSLRDALAALLRDPQRRQRLAEEAGRLGQVFSWAEVARQMQNLYRSL